MIFPPRNDLEYSQKALNAILSRKRLIFNPYTISDSNLLKLVNNASWGDKYDITQAVILTFTRLNYKDRRQETIDRIYFRLGSNDKESFIPASWIIYGITSKENARKFRSSCGNRILRNENDLKWIVGKKFFVSYIIRGYSICSEPRVAYRMHRLYGNVAKDAAIIRRAMCEGKIEMLKRVMTFPHCEDYLSCSPNLFDYKTRISRAIGIISHYSEITPPES